MKSRSAHLLLDLQLALVMALRKTTCNSQTAEIWHLIWVGILVFIDFCLYKISLKISSNSVKLSKI